LISQALTEDWRLEHVRAGDKALLETHKMIADMDEDTDEDPQEIQALTSLIQLLISMAQAHYQAAAIPTSRDH
jgi:hypothetical protein